MAKFNSGAIGALGAGMANASGAPPPPPPEKQKKVQPLSKQVTNKISSSSSKLTELMAWQAKVTDNKVLSLSLLRNFLNKKGHRL